MRKPRPPTLTSIAQAIHNHLSRMSRCRTLNPKEPDYDTSPYFQPSAVRCGSNVAIRYVSYQCTWKLDRDDALEYLNWLEAGNNGKHFQCERVTV